MRALLRPPPPQAVALEEAKAALEAEKAAAEEAAAEREAAFQAARQAMERQLRDLQVRILDSSGSESPDPFPHHSATPLPHPPTRCVAPRQFNIAAKEDLIADLARNEEEARTLSTRYEARMRELEQEVRRPPAAGGPYPGLGWML